ncbi:MAG: hypothetical protein ACHQQQ_13685 [Bacteroidota bacterium]
MDTIEDAAEYVGQFVDYHPHVFGRDIILKGVSNQPRFVQCPTCGILVEEKMVENHIFHHANQHCYLSVNDQIVRDIIVINCPIYKVELILLGAENANVILRNNDHIQSYKFAKRKSLLNDFKQIKDGEIVISVEYGGGKKEFRIYMGAQPQFNSADIDTAANKYLFSRLDHNHDPSFASFQKYTHGGTILENKYAQGFYDYALAFQMAQKDHYRDAKDHFENALGSLLNFRTKFSLTASRVLALHMNCFGLLSDCKLPSRFAIANKFFNDYQTDYKTGSYSYQKTMEYGVYIDDFTDGFLGLLNAFYEKDIPIIDQILTTLYRMPLSQDQNNNDKLSVVSARLAILKHKPDEAKDHYLKLRFHPEFGTEAEQNLN